MPQRYDLIGDVHGCGQTLGMLLRKLGYAFRDGCYRHADRHAIFMGDLFDRGPRVRLAAAMARDMVDAGQATWLLGNHELNVMGLVLGWWKPTQRAQDNAQATLDSFEGHDLDALCHWLQDCPLWWEKDGFRAIHACWDSDAIRRLKHVAPEGVLGNQFKTCIRDAVLGKDLWKITTGPSLRLPDNRVMASRDGRFRRSFRVAFWLKDAETLGDLAFQPDPLPPDLARSPVDEQAMGHMPHYAEDEPPLFFGHYWRWGRPELLGPNLVCLDYSAVLGGPLVAYSHQPRTDLNEARFVTQSTDREFS